MRERERLFRNEIFMVFGTIIFFYGMHCEHESGEYSEITNRFQIR